MFVKLGTHTTYDKRTTPIDFSRSGVKGQGHTLHIVVKPCKHHTDGTVSAMFVKLGTHTTFDKRTSPIAFKDRCLRSRSNLVNKINPFYIANYYVISLLNSPVGRILQRWRCSCFFFCHQDQRLDHSV